jgi:hypothetical protein
METNRITSEKILDLLPNQIFTFGSNESGIHGAGAAKQAMLWGAIWGQAYGLQGQTFAIPTKARNVRDTLSLRAIEVYVNMYLINAQRMPHKHFLTTEIGCGLAGFQPKDIAPLFLGVEEISNVSLPLSFWKVLGHA